MNRTVLCAVDINRPNEERKVLEIANRLAELDDAQLDIITVVPDFGSSMVGRYFQDHHVATARDSAGDELSGFVSDVLGAERNEQVRRGQRIRRGAKGGQCRKVGPDRHRRAPPGFERLPSGPERGAGCPAFRLFGLCGAVTGTFRHVDDDAPHPAEMI